MRTCCSIHLHNFSTNNAHVSFHLTHILSMNIVHIVDFRKTLHENCVEKLMNFMRVSEEGIRLKHFDPPEHLAESLAVLGPCWFLFLAVVLFKQQRAPTHETLP